MNTTLHREYESLLSREFDETLMNEKYDHLISLIPKTVKNFTLKYRRRKNNNKNNAKPKQNQLAGGTKTAIDSRDLDV